MTESHQKQYQEAVAHLNGVTDSEIDEAMADILRRRSEVRVNGIGKVQADHELDLHTTAYNLGLEIRYAVAASGADPIEHLPEVDDILERQFIEIRKAAFDEAARAAEQCGRPTGASDGSTFIPGTSADAARAIRALPGAARQ
jgi:predicted GTPase